MGNDKIAQDGGREARKTANEYDIRLQSVIGCGSRAVKSIYGRFSSAKEFFDYCGTHSDSGIPLSGMTRKRLERVSEASARETAELCERLGIRTVAYGEADYPRRLMQLADPPAVLYVKGELPRLDELCAVTVVGPRRVSEYGKAAAFSLARRLSAAGCVIVSGGAVGTDTMAHLGALSVGGKTVAVLGCGIDCDYPKENLTLREKIAQSGCLISEYPPTRPPSKFTYPQRNRIMSALSCGTAVIEAGRKSGALITASFAAEQGRDVFVIPGSPSEEHYEGSNLLLKDGAKPLLSAADILEEYYNDFRSSIRLEGAAAVSCSSRDLEAAVAEFTGRSQGTRTSRSSERSAEAHTETAVEEPLSDALLASLGEAARSIYLALPRESFTADLAVEAVGGAAAEAIAALTELEIMGLVTALPGGRYRRLK